MKYFHRIIVISLVTILTFGIISFGIIHSLNDRSTQSASGDGVLPNQASSVSSLTSSIVDSASADPLSNGFTFKADDKVYVSAEAPTATPISVEVRMKLSSGTGKSGRKVILGSYENSSTSSAFDLMVMENDCLRYYLKYDDTSSATIDVTFDKVNICTGEWMLVSVVADIENGKLHAYIDGQLTESVSVDLSKLQGHVSELPIRIGRDYYPKRLLIGEVSEIRFWSDIRTEEEIESFSGIPCDGSEDGMSHLWITSKHSVSSKYYIPEGVIEDLSPQAVDLQIGRASEMELSKLDINTGIVFNDSSQRLVCENKLTQAPLSFEAVICMDKGKSGRGGIIAGNYMVDGFWAIDQAYVAIEIYSNGNPRLWWRQYSSGQTPELQNIIFDKVDVRQGAFVHLACTFDPEANAAHCYLNGTLMQTVFGVTFEPVTPAMALMIGGDYRGTGGDAAESSYNAQYFKGALANFSVWSTVLSPSAVKAHYEALCLDGSDVPKAQSGLLGSWSFIEDTSSYGRYEDLSQSQNSVVIFDDWLDADFAEGDYTFVVLPDTQVLARYNEDDFSDLTQWIVDNQEALNISAVIGLGDITDTNTPAQWTAARTAFDIIHKANIPFMPMMGNHDNSASFNAYFNYKTYGSNQSWFGGSYEEGKLDYTYWFVSAGEREYMILSLGWAPDWKVLDWAEDLVKEHQDKNVILTAHAYMNWDDTLLDSEDLHDVTTYSGKSKHPDGAALWERLGRYENVVLAMGGHIGYPDISVYVDKNGANRDVCSILADIQSLEYSHPLGMVMLLTFHNDSDTVDINWYSTKRDQLFRQRNQFSIDVPHIKENAPSPVLSGDVNGDGKINNRDAARIMQYLAGWDVEYVEAALDVNDDNRINNRDAARLMQYLAGWDVEIN